MVVLPYIGLMGKLKFSFHFKIPLNFTSTSIKVENMLKANDIRKKSRKACETGVILVISTFTELPCSSASASSSFPIELTKLKNRSINNHENWHV